MARKQKRCRICGNEGNLIKCHFGVGRGMISNVYFYVMCDKCSNSTPLLRTDETAIEVWNKWN